MLPSLHTLSNEHVGITTKFTNVYSYLIDIFTQSSTHSLTPYSTNFSAITADHVWFPHKKKFWSRKVKSRMSITEGKQTSTWVTWL